ncbi:MAG: acetylxylan esterase [Candidatus Zipacnadales bacterium]
MPERNIIYEAPGLTLLLLLLLATLLPAQGTFTVTATLDHQDGLYRCGEPAVFSVSIRNNGVPLPREEFGWVLTIDGAKQVASGKGQVGEQPTTITGTLAEPGILRLTLTDKEYQVPPNYGHVIGAGFDVERIQPTCVEPADFVAFWEEQKAFVRAIPADLQMEQVAEKSDGRQTTYKISFANINNLRVYGWLSVPTEEGPHPAILTVPAAGYRPYGPASGWAAQGFLSMVLYAHAYPVDWAPERYDELGRTELANYRHEGSENRENYYFRRILTGCIRFMDYLIAHPQWDGKNLIVTGSSQGGGLSIMCAGLEPKVSAIAANVPALCDHTGCLFERACGWPRLIRDQDLTIARVSAYYDAVNFARHAQCVSLVSTGLADSTCPPTSVYSAFAVLPEPKRIVPIPTMGHAHDPTFDKLCNEFILRLGELP